MHFLSVHNPLCGPNTTKKTHFLQFDAFHLGSATSCLISHKLLTGPDGILYIVHHINMTRETGCRQMSPGCSVNGDGWT